MTRNFKALVVIALLILQACSMNAHRRVLLLENPEALGVTGRVRLGVTGESQERVRLSHDISEQAPEVSNAPIYPVGDMKFDAAVGIISRFDLSLALSTLSLIESGVQIRLKAQLLGEPRATAKDGNFSLSLIGGYTSISTRENGTAGLFSTRNYSAEQHTHFADLSVMAGYRFTDTSVVYGAYGWHTGHISATGDIVEDGKVTDSSSTNASVGATSFHLGFLHNKGQGSLGFELAYDLSKIGDRHHNDIYYGVMVGSEL